MKLIADSATWTGSVDGRTWTNNGAMPVWMDGGYYAAADTLYVTVEIAFDANPLVASPAWTDITSQVRGFNLTRGRKSELDDYRGGVANILVDANTGNFDPTDPDGAYWPNIKPMKQLRIRGTYNSVTYPLFRGFITKWPHKIKGLTDETVTIGCVDGFRILANQKDSTAQSEEASDVRIGNLLDEAGWPSGWRTIGTGAITVPAYTPDCATVLSLIREIKDSEGGQFYIDGSGYAVFRNRTYRSAADPVAAFTPVEGGVSTVADSATWTGPAGQTWTNHGAMAVFASTGVPYTDILLDYDDSQIWNRIEVNVGGFPSYSSSTASQDLYGIRTLTINGIQLPNTTDGDDLADVYRDRYLAPLERIERLKFRPDNEPATMYPQVLGRDLSDKVTVTYETNTGHMKTLDSFIESINHRVTLDKWETTWGLSQFE